VRRASKPESVNVRLHVFGVDTTLLHPSFEQRSVVNSLSTGKDLFTSHEEIVRVGEFGVLRIGHGVEGSDLEREFVDNVVISVVLLLDDLSEGLLRRGAMITENKSVNRN
jgi:hypothetical protein